MKVLYCFPEGKFKVLTMSYDDGNTADRRLVSLFNQYGIKGTFNLNYGAMRDGIQDRIDPKEVTATIILKLLWAYMALQPRMAAMKTMFM